MLTVINVSRTGSRERFEAAKRGQHIPSPVKPQIDEVTAETFLDVFAKKLAELYRLQEETKGSV